MRVYSLLHVNGRSAAFRPAGHLVTHLRLGELGRAAGRHLMMVQR